MGTPIPIRVTNRAWLPERAVPNSLLNDYYYETWEHGKNEDGFWEDHKVIIDLVVDSKDKKSLGFPRGNLKKILYHLRGRRVRVIDNRAVAPLGFPLTLAEHVYEDHRWPEQADLIAEWLRAGGGVIKAPAASGKSVIGVALVCEVGLRTLFLFDQQNFLKQWHNEFYDHTDLAEIEDIAGEQLAGRFRSQNKRLYPITFCTFQSLRSKANQQFMWEHRDYFGMVICDETHHVAARTNRNAVMLFNPLLTGGVTATPKRKDKLEDIYFDVLGPIVAAGGSEQMDPEVHLVYTGFEAKSNPHLPDFAQWNYVLNQIVKDHDRNTRICRNVLKNLIKHRCVLIVSERVKHCFKLKEMLSQQWDADRILVTVGPTKNRVQLYKDMDAGRYDVLIASKVIDEGVNVNRLDTLHLATPTASPARAEQRPGRIRRPYSASMAAQFGKKPRPEVYDYVDMGYGALMGSLYIRLRVYKEIGATVIDDRTGKEVSLERYSSRKQRRRSGRSR